MVTPPPIESYQLALLTQVLYLVHLPRTNPHLCHVQQGSEQDSTLNLLLDLVSSTRKCFEMALLLLVYIAPNLWLPGPLYDYKSLGYLWLLNKVGYLKVKDQLLLRPKFNYLPSGFLLYGQPLWMGKILGDFRIPMIPAPVIAVCLLPLACLRIDIVVSGRQI